MSLPFKKFTGLDYLKIDIANNWGLDNRNWDERLIWFEMNKHQLPDLIKDAEEPALFFAGIQAYGKAMRGEPSGYPISLDATASGMQLLACLTGDRKAAELCNVVNTGKREDAYTIVYQRMLDKIGEEGKIKRADTKDAILTSLYGSTAVPKRVFGEGSLLHTFEETMEESAPAVWELNKAFLDMWNPEAYMYSWVLPDNFHVHIKVMNTTKEVVHFLNEPFEVVTKVNAPTEKGRSLGANTIHSLDGMIVREITRRCNYNPKQIQHILDLLTGDRLVQKITKKGELLLTLFNHYEKSGYLSSRVLDCINRNTVGLLSAKQKQAVTDLIGSMPDKPFEVISIHDAFRCLPAYGNDLREQYILQLAQIAQSNLLSYLLAQILEVDEIEIQKYDPDLWKDILKTEYALS